MMMHENPAEVNDMTGPARLFLKPELQGKEKAGIKEKTELEEDLDKGSFLLCRQCLALITSTSERIDIEGAHQHTFANPHGIVFEIGCFRNAWGCGAVGSPTNEFTWFAGYFWQVAVCASCLTHIGWQFTSPEASGFYGLILERLMESDIT
ncbi:MAG: cereblon family protein [Desulfobacterales bacterium]